MKYRPEIDGLRALAVLPVVLYHAQLRIGGGYVGVDVFFVISGYLITMLISREIAGGTFSLANFWARRIRRIMPAAAVAVLASLLAGYFLLLPAHFEELGRSAVAQAMVAANFFFYRESGYFATAAQSKPLLHFWSLAVEEQFYLFFPVLLMAVRRWRPSLTFGVVSTLAAGSFALSVVGVYSFPEATFYLLPARIWELALGGLLALRGDRLPLPESTRGLLGWTGMALIVGPVFLYRHDTPFPGLAAVPPCLGAALVIWSTAAGTGRLRRLLALRPVVFVGLLSYSLYLWHWPVIVYSDYWRLQPAPLPARLAMVAGSFVLAWLSWRYVETPFRKPATGGSRRRVIVGALAATGAAGLIGAVISNRGGLPGRFSPDVLQYSSAYYDHPEQAEADVSVGDAEAGKLHALSPEPAAGTSTVLLWGDSHARAVSPAVEAMCEQLKIGGYRASHSGTACLLKYGNAEAQRFNDAVFHWIEQHRPTWVVLVSRWEVILTSPYAETSLRETVQRIQALGVKVCIMRQVASQRADIPKALAKAVLLHEDVGQVGISVTQNLQRTRRSNDTIDRVVASAPGLQAVDPIPFISRDHRCLAAVGGRALYYDNQHLTRYGAGFLTPMFVSLVEMPLPSGK